MLTYYVMILICIVQKLIYDYRMIIICTIQRKKIIKPNKIFLKLEKVKKAILKMTGLL